MTAARLVPIGARAAKGRMLGILLACGVAGCVSTRPSPLTVESGTLRSLRGARCFALSGPEESVAALRSELEKRLPDTRLVSVRDADVIINFNGEAPTECIDCGEGWRPGFFSSHSAFASIERQGCEKGSQLLMTASWSHESYSVQSNARALVALLYPLLVGKAACSCSCGQRIYIFPNCG